MTHNVVRSKLIVCKNTFLATKHNWYLQLFLSWLIIIIIYVDIFPMKIRMHIIAQCIKNKNKNKTVAVQCLVYNDMEKLS